MTKRSAKSPPPRTAARVPQRTAASRAPPVRLRTVEQRFSDILREHEAALSAFGPDCGPTSSFAARPVVQGKAAPHRSLRSPAGNPLKETSFIGSLPSSLQAVVAASRRAPTCFTAAPLASRARTRKDPVQIEGTSLGESYQSLAWCQHVRGYAQESGRAARGRTYLINGAVTDLAISPGLVEAEVQGEEAYRVTIQVDPLSEAAWEHLSHKCTQSFGASIELLQQHMPDEVVKRLCQSDGLFPRIGELDIQCTCPDYAPVCKHVVAVLYGVGVRAGADLEVLFTLRSATSAALHAQAKALLTAPGIPLGPVDSSANARSQQRSRRMSEEQDLSVLFGIELAH
jgi:uncharacterized Zn finger protein